MERYYLGVDHVISFLRAPPRSPIFKDPLIVFTRRKKKKSYLFIGHGIWNPNPFPSVIQVANIRLGTFSEHINKTNLLNNNINYILKS